MVRYALILGFMMSAPARADAAELPAAVYPRLPPRAATTHAFVPRGWSSEQIETADFDGDGIEDVLMLLRGNDPDLILNGDGLGMWPLNTNPRLLAAAFGSPSGGYRLAFQSRIVPRHESATLDDPLGELKRLKNGFSLRLHYFANAGSWLTANTTFNFRYQDGCFRLIGYDRAQTHRASLDTSAISVNYLTGKVKTSTGNAGNDREKVRWHALAGPRRVCVEAIADGWAFAPETGNDRRP